MTSPFSISHLISVPSFSPRNSAGYVSVSCFSSPFWSMTVFVDRKVYENNGLDRSMVSLGASRRAVIVIG
jgi:hypothetical protein